MIVVIAWLAPPSPAQAQACSCVSRAAPCEQLWRGDRQPTVFEATVESIDVVSNAADEKFPQRIVRLRDSRSWIGSPPTIVSTGPGDCGYPFSVGRRYLIDATVNPEGQLEATRCSLTRPIELARDVIAYLESLSRPSRGATLRGAVRFMRGGRVLSGAPRGVELDGIRITIDGPVARSTSTGADGRFAFEALPPGEYTVTPDASGQNHVVLAQPEPGPVPSRLANAHACAEVLIVLAVDGTISGTVVDEQGAPVQDVAVGLRPDGSGPGLVQMVSTDESGGYRFANLPPDRYSVGVRLGRGPTLTSPFIVLGASGPTETVRLEAGQHLALAPLVVRKLERITVTGRATWADGRPAVGLRLAVMTAAADGSAVSVGATYPDAGGDFRIDLLESVRYFILPPGAVSPPEGFDFVAGSGPVAITLPPAK